MYLKIANKEKGRYLTIVEKYWDKDKKCSREKTKEIIGYLDPSSEDYEKLVSFYKQKATEMTRKKNDDSNLNISIDLNEELPINYDDIYRLDHALSKTQKVILKAFDMDQAYCYSSNYMHLI